MSESNKEGDILKYTEIKDNTINLVIPYCNSEEEERISKCFQIVFGDNDEVEKFPLKHLNDGCFKVFQIRL